MLKGTALRRMVMSLLETGRHPMTVFTMSLWTRNPTPCSCLSSFPLKRTLCPSSVVVSPKFLPLNQMYVKPSVTFTHRNTVSNYPTLTTKSDVEPSMTFTHWNTVSKYPTLSMNQMSNPAWHSHTGTQSPSTQHLPQIRRQTQRDIHTLEHSLQVSNTYH